MLIDNRILDDVFPTQLGEKSVDLVSSTKHYRINAEVSFGDINNNSEYIRNSQQKRRERSESSESKDSGVDSNSYANSDLDTTCKKCDKNCKVHDDIGTKLDCDKQTEAYCNLAEVTSSKKSEDSSGNKTDKSAWSKWIPSFLLEPEYILNSLNKKGL